MTVTVPAIGALVVYNQGNNPQMPGGSRLLPAVVLGVAGLVVALRAFAPEGEDYLADIKHISTAAAGSDNWAWTTASGNSNS